MRSAYLFLASALAACTITTSPGTADASDANGSYQAGTVARAVQPFIDNHTLAGAVVLALLR